jgi:hypothetical protein
MNRLPAPMFQASTIIRGHQIRTSPSPRTASITKKVSRPTCDAPSRTHRPIAAKKFMAFIR